MDRKAETQVVSEWTDRDRVAPEDETPSPPAWEVLYEGAYMPRRVRGSWRGGVLG